MKFSVNLIKTSSPPHRHSYYEIIVYINGNALFRTDDSERIVSKGDIIIIPPDTMHCSYSENEYERIYISGVFNRVFSLTEPVIITDNLSGEGLTLAKTIYKNRFANDDYVSALCNAFAHFLLQSINMDDTISVAIREIINEITDNFHNPELNLSYLLQKSGYTEDYIRAQFKRITKKSPVEFLTDVRISHACFLIDTYKSALSLSEVAEKCGYTDYVYFSRRFKKFMGVSPQKYKNMN